ncbi:hypothetical protein NLI96_g10053 [Meripilus lineatus]|uniref:ABM domain-containing protein n=1 Tax=Meripilus lineatus TaxID=2056292 RepID=A0AAD5UVU4_9APHY|nr:hypothetical protein NLI96_g10053 [Physisporinus lineatus]
MPGVVEIARFASNEAYRSDPAVINPSLEILSRAKGVQAIFHGIQVEDEETVYIVIIWDRVEDHKALIDDQDAYTKLRTNLAKCGSTEHHILHVPLLPDPLAQLRAPLTEFSFMTLKPGQSAQELGDFMNVVLEKSGTSLKVRYGTSWGKTVEKDDLFFLVMGWNSLQDHQKNIEENEENITLTAQLLKLVDFKLTHVELQEYRLQ